MVESTKPEKKEGDDYPFEKMLDPLGDRVMKDVPRPPRYPLKYDQMFTAKNSMYSNHKCLKILVRLLTLQGVVKNKLSRDPRVTVRV